MSKIRPNVHFILFIFVQFAQGSSPKNDHRVTLLFVGDISFTATTKYYVEHGYHSYNDTFKEVASYIREADVSIGNLESPFVGDKMYQYVYRKGKKSVILDSDPIAVSALSFAGFDAVTLANNHLIDFSEEGVNFTVKTLNKAKIKHFGDSYGKWTSSQKPLILEVKGTKIGFLGYCDSPSVLMYKNCTEMRMLFNSGPAVYTDDIATRDVHNLRQADVDLIVVLIHFGDELQIEPSPYQRRIAKHLISLGVQIIIGAHPHVLQPHCFLNNTLVAYSLGNFLFYPRRVPGASQLNVYGRLGRKPNKKLIKVFERFVLGNCKDLKKTMMLKVTVSRNRLLEAEYLPVEIKFDFKSKLLHPKPSEGSEWIQVCGKKDKQCERKCRWKDGQTRAETNK
ncbi:capsule biosynthesis protein CapA-like isoform X1 [Acropora muricata]|uniref:capsule biosynthesis protein CapA-like isoform X1 n=1 Tax=Acropora muricata TaxID=159855 RepID=UPI0034E49337